MLKKGGVSHGHRAKNDIDRSHRTGKHKPGINRIICHVIGIERRKKTGTQKLYSTKLIFTFSELLFFFKLDFFSSTL